MRRTCLGVLFGVAGCLGAEAAYAQARDDAPAFVATGPFELGLHARASRASARNERAAWLTLTLPLDALGAPRLLQAPVAPPAPPAPPERAPQLAVGQLRALSAFARKTKAIALGVVNAASERQRLDALATRARASAALPELRLRAQRDTDQALRWAPTEADPYRVTQADGAGTTLEASVTFQLDRLLFSRDELAIERLRADAAAERSKLEARVQNALWGLLRAHALACVPGIDEGDRVEHLAQLIEHFGVLDDLTAGWFSGQAEAFARSVWGFPEAISGHCAPSGPESAAEATKAVASLENSE